jgi:hypothetical protein
MTPTKVAAAPHPDLVSAAPQYAAQEDAMQLSRLVGTMAPGSQPMNAMRAMAQQGPRPTSALTRAAGGIAGLAIKGAGPA